MDANRSAVASQTIMYLPLKLEFLSPLILPLRGSVLLGKIWRNFLLLKSFMQHRKFEKQSNLKTLLYSLKPDKSHRECLPQRTRDTPNCTVPSETGGASLLRDEICLTRCNKMFAALGLPFFSQICSSKNHTHLAHFFLLFCRICKT